MGIGNRCANGRGHSGMARVDCKSMKASFVNLNQRNSLNGLSLFLSLSLLTFSVRTAKMATYLSETLRRTSSACVLTVRILQYCMPPMCVCGNDKVVQGSPPCTCIFRSKSSVRQCCLLSGMVS